MDQTSQIKVMAAGFRILRTADEPSPRIKINKDGNTSIGQLKMKHKMITIVSIILATYLLLFWDFTTTYSTSKKMVNVEYNGLLWVGLDYWSIWKYKSDDNPMKWLNVTRS